MDLLPGETLRKRLQRQYRLELPAALWIARQTVEALAAMHRNGFVHGDIKPDNIRLVDDGTAILIDLGFAHRPGENAAFLEQGYVLGTIIYLAPELCGTEPHGDLSADLFSLGVTLFEMLTGELPYPAGSLEQTMRRHLHEPPPNLRRLAGPLPTPLVHLIERLLAREPQERPKATAGVQQLIALEIAALSRRKVG
jgi:serine/threonine protein kinase